MGALWIVALILLLCVFLDKISAKFGLPTLLAFIVLGMLFGNDGILKIQYDNYRMTEEVCSIALVFIMFYGGFGTNWQQAKPIAGKAVLLSTAGVVLTMLVSGVLTHVFLRFTWIESFLLSAVLASTDAASVFSILRSKKLNLKEHTASLLELESGSNDPFAYMLTMIFIFIAQGHGNAFMILKMLFHQVFFGILFGLVFAKVTLSFLNRYHFSTSGFDLIFIIAAVLFAYAVPSQLGGNGYLSVYLVGVIIGNAKIPNKVPLVHFFDGLTGLAQIVIFFLLGLLATPSAVPNIFSAALVMAMILTFAARPIAVFLLMRFHKSTMSQKLLVSWSGLRGAASIVFAIMAVQNVVLQNDLYHIVFMVVLFSILFQGTCLPILAKRMHMIDDKEDVLKTFNDYSNETSAQYIQITVYQGNPWIGKPLRELHLPDQSLIVLILRDGERIVPNGSTVIEAGDSLILSALMPEAIKQIQLVERTICTHDTDIGKKLSEIRTYRGELIMMIKRDGQVIIPNGQEVLCAGDILVMNRF